ncbi:hypothetical protein, partial [Yersinia pseudotuberculosis]|uniref:hypothetical protein n=1 Tax=Yersinia pseudotuberculosis TaxID=633 RepID=UPI00200161DB
SSTRNNGKTQSKRVVALMLDGVAGFAPELRYDLLFLAARRKGGHSWSAPPLLNFRSAGNVRNDTLATR